MLIRYQRTTDRVANQGGYTNDCKHGTSPHADLSDIGNLGNQGWSERDEGAAAETVEGSKQDVRDIAPSGEPECEDEDGAEEGGYDHGVEAAGFISDVAWNSPAKDGH